MAKGNNSGISQVNQFNKPKTVPSRYVPGRREKNIAKELKEKGGRMIASVDSRFQAESPNDTKDGDEHNYSDPTEVSLAQTVTKLEVDEKNTNSREHFSKKLKEFADSVYSTDIAELNAFWGGRDEEGKLSLEEKKELSDKIKILNELLKKFKTKKDFMLSFQADMISKGFLTEDQLSDSEIVSEIEEVAVPIGKKIKKQAEEKLAEMKMKSLHAESFSANEIKDSFGKVEEGLDQKNESSARIGNGGNPYIEKNNVSKEKRDVLTLDETDTQIPVNDKQMVAGKNGDAKMQPTQESQKPDGQKKIGNTNTTSQGSTSIKDNAVIRTRAEKKAYKKGEIQTEEKGTPFKEYLEKTSSRKNLEDVISGEDGQDDEAEDVQKRDLIEQIHPGTDQVVGDESKVADLGLDKSKFTEEIKRIESRLKELYKEKENNSWLNLFKWGKRLGINAEISSLELKKNLLERDLKKGITFENAKLGGHTADFSVAPDGAQISETGFSRKSSPKTIKDIDEELSNADELYKRAKKEKKEAYKQRMSSNILGRLWNFRESEDLRKIEKNREQEISRLLKRIKTLEKQKMKLLSKEIKEGKKDLKAFKRLNERELGDITNEKLTEAEKALKEKIDARLEISRNFRGYELFLKKIRWDKEYRKKVAKDVSVAVALGGIGYMTAGASYPIILSQFGLDAGTATLAQIIAAKAAAGTFSGVVSGNIAFGTNAVLNKKMRELFKDDKKGFAKAWMGANIKSAIFGGIGGAISGGVSAGAAAPTNTGVETTLIDNSLRGAETTFGTEANSQADFNPREANPYEKNGLIWNEQTQSYVQKPEFNPGQNPNLYPNLEYNENTGTYVEPGKENIVNINGDARPMDGVILENNPEQIVGVEPKEPAQGSDVSPEDGPDLGSVTFQGNESFWRIMEQKLGMSAQEISKEITTRADLVRFLEFIQDKVQAQGVVPGDNYVKYLDDLQFAISHKETISIKDPFWKFIPDGLKINLEELRSVINK